MTHKLRIGIGGMNCSFCEEGIRRAYTRMPGVSRVAVSLAHEEALVEYDEERVDEADVKGLLVDLGYTVRDLDRLLARGEERSEARAARRRLLVAGSLAGVALALMALMWVGVRPTGMREAQAILASLSVFGAGSKVLHMAWASLRRASSTSTFFSRSGRWGRTPPVCSDSSTRPFRPISSWPRPS